MKSIQLNKIILPLLFLSSWLSAQEGAWPVSVSGSLLPPHSLDLKVYGLERSEDFRFQLLLNDPVETSLIVKPRISIEQNGRVIYLTDPNFGGETFLLNQFEPMLLNGSDLQNYISNVALVGAGGNGRGSVEVPEGFNQICLQMYGVIRDVPISNKFCVSGNFRLNQPPQIVKPMFNEKIKLAPVQNMIFSWQPMHLGSGNNPGAVEYLFEMVELPFGVLNANDAFESSLKVFNTTTMATSLLYSQAEPVLEPHKIYAWRVTARSIMHPSSKLFQNEGRSEISVFVMYDGEEPSVMLNPADNASPRGCSVYETSYGPVAKSDNEPMVLIPNQKVKVGYFDMVISEVSGGMQGYSGKGWVEYPMLRSILEVDFKNIQINKEGRVYQSERISAVIDPALAIDVNNISKDKLEKIITSSYLYQLNTELNKSDKNVSKIPEGSEKRNSLPLELRSGEAAPGVSVVGIEFTPTNAFISFISQSNEGGIYAATLIPSTPYGIKSNAHLTALNVAGFKRTPVKLLESIETGAVLSDNSKMNCNCKGFESLKEESQLSISTNIMSRADNQAPVTLTPVKKSVNYEEALIKVEKIPDFKVKGLNDLTFKAQNGLLDLNNNSNNFNNVSNDYTSGLKPNWKGLRLYDVETTLPEKYNIINSKSSLTLDKGEIYIDENELAYGQLYKTNVLEISKGKMGPWNYSIDTMMVKMKGSELGKLQVNGKIKTPFFDEQFPYNAIVSEGYSQQIQLDAVVPDTKLGMSIWNGNFVTKSPSTIDAKLVQTDNSNVLTPKCSFNGELSIQFTDQEFKDAIINQNKGLVLEELKKAFNIDNFNFNLSGLSVEGFISDPFKEKDQRYKAEKFDLKNVNLMIGNQSQKLTDSKLSYINNEGVERLGLKTTIVKNNTKVEMIIWAKAKNETLEFEGIELKNIELNCNCIAYNVIPTPEEWNIIVEEFYSKTVAGNEKLKTQKSGMQKVEQDILTALSKEIVINQIKENAISWFPSLDNNSAIYIPFLERNLKIENKNNTYQGAYKHPLYSNNKTLFWNEKLFNDLKNAETGDLDLPLIITEDLWSKFGFKGSYTLPDNFKLYISEFKSSTTELTSATIKIDLVGMLEVDGKKTFAHFTSLKDIEVGPAKINLKDVQLILIKDVKLNSSIQFLSSAQGTESNETAENASIANLSCTGGLSSFNIQGHFLCSKNTLVNMNDARKIKATSTFGFNLIEDEVDGNPGLLVDFVAPLKISQKENQEWKPWKFATEANQHIIFSAGNSFEGYLDFSPSKSASISKSELNKMDDFSLTWIQDEVFTGLVFTQIEFEVPALEKKRISETNFETFKDVIVNSYYEMESSAFFASYEGFNKVLKADNARLGGWKYNIDTVSLNYQFNALDENQLMFKGAIKMPLFKEAPEKDKEKWLEDYTDAWVGFSLNLEYDKTDNIIGIQGFVNAIDKSLFESVHIDGLGFQLSNESSVDFYFDRRLKKLIGRSNLNGRGVYTVKKLDAKITTFKFQNFRLNYTASGICKSSGIEGIESIDFGTWGVAGFTDQEIAGMKKAGTVLSNSQAGNNLKQKLSENKFAKSVGSNFSAANKLVGFDINIHQPKFQCTGSEFKFIIGLDLSIIRDKNHLNENQQKAYDNYHPVETANNKKNEEEKNLAPLKAEYEKSQQDIKKIAKEKSDILKEKQKLELELKVIKAEKSKDFKTSVGRDMAYKSDDRTVENLNKIKELNQKSSGVDKRYKEALTTVKEKYQPFKAQNIKVKEASKELDSQTKAAVVKQQDIEAKNKTLGGRIENNKTAWNDKLKEAKETKTGAFSAGGSIEVSFTATGFKDVALTCLALGGEFGPVKFNGGINIFRDETSKETFDPNAIQSEWGNGFLGLIEMKVLDYEFKTKFQTGIKFDIPDGKTEAEDYRYWFGDLSFNGNPGLPFGQTGFSLTGVGGGVFYNMTQVLPDFEKVKKESPKDVSTNSKPAAKANNDLCKVQGLKAGESLSGIQYAVKRGNFGFHLMAEVSHTASVSLENVVSIEMQVLDGEFKFINLGLQVNGYCLYDDYGSRKTASPVVVKGKVDVNFEKYISVQGGIDFRFGKKAGPIEIASPSNKNSDPDAWNKIRFLFSSSENYVHVGSWGASSDLSFYRNNVRPASDLNMLSAGFSAPLFGKIFAGLYFQGGTKIDAFPSVTNFMPSYKGTIKPLPSDQKAHETNSGAIAGFILNADLKGGFFIVNWDANGLLGANLSVAKFKKSEACNADGSSIGFSNGYYARGNVFAHLDSKVTLDVDILLAKGSYEIFNGQMDFVMDFGFPNPAYLQGEFAFSYSILGGLRKGKETIDFDAGQKPCVIRVVNPVTGIDIHKSIFPADGTVKVKHLDTIRAEINLPYMQDYCVEKSIQGTSTKLPQEFIRCKLKSFVLREKSSKTIVKTKDILTQNSQNLEFVILENLKPETVYEVVYNYVWEESKDGKVTYTVIPNSDEKGTSEFTTIEANLVITNDLLEYAMPGSRQRYWNQDYAIPCLKFNRAMTAEKIKNIFPDDNIYFYFAIINEHKADGSVVTHKIPIENVPTADKKNKRFSDGVEDEYNTFSNQRDQYQKKYFDDVFSLNGTLYKNNMSTINTLTEQGYLSLRHLNNLPLSKGSLCNMIIYRKSLKKDASDDVASILADSKEEENANQVAIYHNSFGISIYPNMNEKMKDITVSYGVSETSITSSKRNLEIDEIMVQNAVNRSIEEDLKIIPKNAYLGINGLKEGIDSFDVFYLTRKSRLCATGDLNFADWNDKELSAYESNYYRINKYIDKQSSYSFTYRFLEKGKLRRSYDSNSPFGDQTYFSGRPIDYTIFTDHDGINKYEISDEEITAGKLNNVSLGKNEENGFIYDGTSEFDFVIEDGFQSLRVLQYLLIKNRLEEKHNILFSEFPPENEIWISTKNNNNTNFNILSNGVSHTFDWKDYYLGDYYFFLETDNKASEWNEANGAVGSENWIKLPVNRSNLK